MKNNLAAALAFAFLFGIAAICAADVRQAFLTSGLGYPHPNNDKVFRIPLEGPDKYELIEFAGPEDGISSPYAIAVHPSTGRLYVGNLGTGELLEFEINADGTKGSSRVYGELKYECDGKTWYPHYFSMAVRPYTGRIYVGCFYGSAEMKGIFIMREDGSGADKLVDDSTAPYFYDECWIAINPSDDGIVYAGTGWENHIRMFDADDGTDLGFIQSYDDVAYHKDGPPGYYLPHQFFVPRGDDLHDLIAPVYIEPGVGPRFLIRFEPAGEPGQFTFAGELPGGGSTLTFNVGIFDFVHENVTDNLYAGAYRGFFEIDSAYSTCTAIHQVYAYDLPEGCQNRVAVSYGHSTGADTDHDGLTDDGETGVYGTDPLDADSDADALTDYEEIMGGYGTSPLDPNQDNDLYSDLVEIAGGSSPTEYGWTAPEMTIRMSFGPSTAARPAGFAVDGGWSFNADRNYGWLDD